MPTDDIFNIDVPKPLWQFGRAKQTDFVTNQDRIFDKADYRRAKRTLRRLLRVLKRNRVNEALVRLDELKRQNETLKTQFYALKSAFDEANDTAIKRDLIRQRNDINAQKSFLLAEYTQLIEAITPYRDDLARAHTLARDIKQHEDYLADERLKKQLYRGMEKEANLNAEIIIRRWGQLGYDQEITHKGKTKTIRPRIERIVVKPDEVQYKIFASRMALFAGTIDMMPRGVRIWNLVNPDTLIDLEAAVKRPVSSPHYPSDGSKGADFSNGAWIVVSRLGVRDGLLERVPYGAVMGRYPHNDSKLIPLPLGVKSGRIINWVYIAKQPHLLVTGQTGGGKSNLINLIIATLISQHKPTDVRIILIDLKEGVELSKFASVPHAIGGVVDSVRGALDMVQRVEKMRMERNKIIGKIATDIDTYNAKVGESLRLPRVFLFFDEIGALAIEKDTKKEVDTLLAQLAMKGRSTGIHIIIGAQTPYNDIVPNTVKANITITLEGRQRTLGASMSSSGDKSSTELPKLPGRMWCNDGMDRYLVQLPYISDSEIATAIAIANQNPPAPSIWGVDEDTQPVKTLRGVSDEQFIDYVLEIGGLLHIQKLFAKCKDDGLSRQQVTLMVKEIVALKTIYHKGDTYLIKRNGPGFKLVLSPNSGGADVGIRGISGISEDD